MKAKAVIFDKDGTLLDFDSFWVSVSEKAIAEVLCSLNANFEIVSEVLCAYGVKDGKTDPDGVLCKGTYEEMAHIFCDIVNSHGIALSHDNAADMVVKAYNNNSVWGDVKPTSDNLVIIFEKLSQKGIKIALVTTDNIEITELCLEKLGILKFFEKIYTDDGENPTKPDPFCANDFCNRLGLEKESVLMVGDTMTDVNFAKNAKIACAVLASDEKRRAMPELCADYVIQRLDELLDIIE